MPRSTRAGRGYTHLGAMQIIKEDTKECQCPFCKMFDKAHNIYPVDKTSAYKFDVYIGKFDAVTRRRLREIDDFVHVGNELYTLFFVKSGYMANDADADYVGGLLGADWVKVGCGCVG